MKVWAVFLVVINCGGSYNDSLELHGIYSDQKKAEQAAAAGVEVDVRRFAAAA